MVSISPKTAQKIVKLSLVGLTSFAFLTTNMFRFNDATEQFDFHMNTYQDKSISHVVKNSRKQLFLCDEQTMSKPLAYSSTILGAPGEWTAYATRATQHAIARAAVKMLPDNVLRTYVH